MSVPVFPVVRARRLAQRPAVRRALVVGLAIATGLVVAGLVRSGDAARRSWGATRPVAVATRDLAPGAVVGPDAVEVRDLPSALVPASAVSDVVPGAVVRQPVSAGEALVPGRLAPDGLTGTAALVPDGYRAVSVPSSPAGFPPVVVGDQVDVLAVLPPELVVGSSPDSPTSEGPTTNGSAANGSTADPGDDDAREPAFPLVERAIVVDVGDDAVAVAVPVQDAPRVAYTLAQGAVVLALAGP
jgi:hypothetical protein